jgi:succinate dehydrogenase/fumarate reductase flavoprotein subunit
MVLLPQNEASFRPWPYPVRYDQETVIETDVLVLGGGIAGCHAAINAAREGARVLVLDKGPIIRSGSGGAGVDHWHMACTNPCSKVSPEEMVQIVDEDEFGTTTEWGNGISCYILCKESYDTLLDMERMGTRIRDVDDEFVGASFRDDKTKFMFAYDYENRFTIRVFGWDFKPALHREMKRLSVDMLDYVMATSLLTEGGRQGGRVVGATAINVRTGEFYVINAKATIITTGQPLRLWVFSHELQGYAAIHDDPNCAGDGCAMAWRAGAELALMERSAPHAGGFRAVAYGTGNAHNTWYACNIVDAQGKEVPWVDRDGRVLSTLDERHRPAPGQKFFLFSARVSPQYQGPSLIPDLPDRIRAGEFKLPLYADLPSMPEHERRVIFGMMVGQEGNTRIPVYQVYTEAGFDPDKDMLQATVLPPNEYVFTPWWKGTAVPQWRETGGLVDSGGVLFDWDLRTTLEGLYAAGNQLAGGSDHAGSAATGRYAGRKAAGYAADAALVSIDRDQVILEKDRVYGPIRNDAGLGWKELQAGICRIMQDYCGEYKSEEILRRGLDWLHSIEESELQQACARNPHELMRVLEASVRLSVGRAIMEASRARQASSASLGFKRIDFPQVDPPEWRKLVTIRLEDDRVTVGEKPWNYWACEPNRPTYEENYQAHCGL